MSGPIRRSQAISPFGIGALVDFPGPVSLIHAGLDAWPFDESDPKYNEFKIDDEKRLARRLNVDYFVQPPDFRKPERGFTSKQPNLNLTLPFLRFPLWHQCTSCGRMHRADYHHHVAPICKGPIGSGKGAGGMHGSRKTSQVRFVAACQHGHLQDFPWLEWLFETSNPSWQPDSVSRWLRIRSTGSASLTGIEVRAEELDESGAIQVVKKRTLAGAFEGNPTNGSPSAFSKIGIKCLGNNPALAITNPTEVNHNSCGQDLYPLLRGASNLYFPHVVSSIYIPDVDDSNIPQEVLELLDNYQFKTALLQSAQNADGGKISTRAVKNAVNLVSPQSNVDPEVVAEAANHHLLAGLITDHKKISNFLDHKIKASQEKHLTEEMIRFALNTHYPEWDIDPKYLVTLVNNKIQAKGLNKNAVQNSQREDELDFRREEYRIFCRDIQDGYPKTNLLIRSSEISSYSEVITSYFDRISLLHKLRETRAFIGYSRIFPENDLNQDEKNKLISKHKKDWLPAIIVKGEGIFIKFREDKLNAWISIYGPLIEKRLNPINKNLAKVKERRHQIHQTISPKYVLIHTFAHLLINQLVYDCGYGSASLRERIYCDDKDPSMSGVLIYTAAGDSEGTMGGLVRMGQPGYLEKVIAKALEKAQWCSSDPVCSETQGQGPDNCNLGACHSCALLPETSCEQQNRLLDRGVVIGTLESPKMGFFSKT